MRTAARTRPLLTLGQVATAAALVTSLAPTTASAGTTDYSAPLTEAVADLPVSAEQNDGYDRDKHFGRWADEDGDCQNARAEVLIEESSTEVTFTTPEECTVDGGTWTTTWDGVEHKKASETQIDHTVPLHEAWGSGARDWEDTRRKAYANDLGDERFLTAQTSALNSEKGSKGPEEWLPPRDECTYVADWSAMKVRWRLDVDETEKATMEELAASCPETTVEVTIV
ncbi:HNH endonuclease family protein [Kytococcus sp. Marseille-QA3725]